MNTPRVSIGMPVYNGENFIRETLDSLLAQTFKDFEIIISDNASTDQTEAICREYALKDPRIRYYRNDQNLGAARNYNRTVELARGEYFKWAAHDDLCAPEYLEKCVNVLDRLPTVVLCYTQFTYIDDQGTPINTCSNLLNLRSSKSHERFMLFQQLMFDVPASYDRWTPIFGLIRTEALKKTPLIGTYVGSDIPLLTRLVLMGEFYEVPESLFFIREHSQRSVRRSYQEIACWFDPNNKGKIVFPLWRELVEHFVAINQAQINLLSKMACHTQMRVWIQGNWKRLIKEVVMVGLQVLDRTHLWQFKATTQKW